MSSDQNEMQCPDCGGILVVSEQDWSVSCPNCQSSGDSEQSDSSDDSVGGTIFENLFESSVGTSSKSKPDSQPPSDSSAAADAPLEVDRFENIDDVAIDPAPVDPAPIDLTQFENVEPPVVAPLPSDPSGEPKKKRRRPKSAQKKKRKSPPAGAAADRQKKKRKPAAEVRPATAGRQTAPPGSEAAPDATAARPDPSGLSESQLEDLRQLEDLSPAAIAQHMIPDEHPGSLEIEGLTYGAQERDEIYGVKCHICDTRIHVREHQDGKSVECPICFTKVKVKLSRSEREEKSERRKSARGEMRMEQESLATPVGEDELKLESLPDVAEDQSTAEPERPAAAGKDPIDPDFGLPAPDVDLLKPVAPAQTEVDGVYGSVPSGGRNPYAADATSAGPGGPNQNEENPGAENAGRARRPTRRELYQQMQAGAPPAAPVTGNPYDVPATHPPAAARDAATPATPAIPGGVAAGTSAPPQGSTLPPLVPPPGESRASRRSSAGDIALAPGFFDMIRQGLQPLKDVGLWLRCIAAAAFFAGGSVMAIWMNAQRELQETGFIAAGKLVLFAVAYGLLAWIGTAILWYVCGYIFRDTADGAEKVSTWKIHSFEELKSTWLLFAIGFAIVWLPLAWTPLWISMPLQFLLSPILLMSAWYHRSPVQLISPEILKDVREYFSEWSQFYLAIFVITIIGLAGIVLLRLSAIPLVLCPIGAVIQTFATVLFAAVTGGQTHRTVSRL